MNCSEPLVTVLTPVYNGERYLRQSIESVLGQTYSNWEYIIVNNCSTDQSLEITQSYAAKEPRIRIRNNEHFVDVMRNHNIAFQEISPQSQYCKVVQADDWLFPNCISEMVKIAEANPTVGIVGSYCLDNERVKCDGLPYPSTVVSGCDICRLTLLGQIYLFWSPTALLVCSDLVRRSECYYGEPQLHGDDEATYEALRYCDFGFVHQVLTYIRRHDETVTSRSARRFNAMLLAKLDLLLKFGPVYLSETEYRERLSGQMKDYYRFLATNLFRLSDRREFWDLHVKGLESLGQPLSKLCLTKELCLEVADILLNPKRTAKTLLASVLK